VCRIAQTLSRERRKLVRMIEKFSVRVPRLAVIASLATIVLSATTAFAQAPPSLGSASTFAVLGGPAVTCTGPAAVTGDVGVLLSTGFTNTGCTISGTVHPGDAAAVAAYAAFLSAYMNLATLNANPLTCDTAHTLTGLTLAGLVLSPGVYCVDATAKAGLLTLDPQGNADAAWTFLVNGALTGTGFNVVVLNPGQACNVSWWVKGATTLTDSTFVGTILAGAAITVTRGSFMGHALATAAATLTGPFTSPFSVCSSTTVTPPPNMEKCEDHRDHDGDHDDKDHDKNRKDHDDKDHDSKDHDSSDHDNKDK
jgi:hypothetical protein